MLYHVYEMNHLLAKPWRLAAKTVSQLAGHRLNPLGETRAGRYLTSACDLFLSLTDRYDKPEWHLPETRINGAPIPVSVDTQGISPFCHLLHFRRDSQARLAALGRERYDPRVLIVAPLSGHYATLLRGTVAAMLPEHEVYITDWQDARQVPRSAGHWDLNDYIDDVIACLRHIGPRAHVIAICQPGPAVLAGISCLSEQADPDLPASLTVMGSPIDTRRSPTTPNRLAQNKPYRWFENNVIHRVPPPHAGAMRRVYPGFLQLSGFISMNGAQHMDAHLAYFKNLVAGDGDSVHKHREFYQEYLAVLDLTAEFYLQTIRDVFQDHSLPRGTFSHRGQMVRPQCITDVALLTVEGEHDDISGIGQTQAAHDLCCNIPQHMKFDYVQPGVGHYGIFNGSRFRNEVQPRIRDFIRSHFDREQEQDLRRRAGSSQVGQLADQ